MEGAGDGAWLGDREILGDMVGATDGVVEGAIEGSMDGTQLGLTVGDRVGLADGTIVGALVVGAVGDQYIIGRLEDSRLCSGFNKNILPQQRFTKTDEHGREPHTKQ